VHVRGHMDNLTLFRSASFIAVALSPLALAPRAQAADNVIEVRAPEDTAVRVRRTAVERFGEEGQKAISSDVGLSISNTTVSGVDGSSTVLVLRPALDVFVVDSVSVGGFVGVEYASSPGGSSQSVSVGPRVGYDFFLSNRLSFWPKVGFAVARTSQTDDGATLPSGVVVGDADEDNTSVQLNLFAPIMFHPVPHFFLGLGPALDQDLTGDAKATVVAVRLTIGGWI
jgi:opacity protein-like surface antigen